MEQQNQKVNEEALKLVDEFLRKHMAKICPEPLLSVYLADNIKVPNTHIDIVLDAKPLANIYKKVITIYFMNNPFARAEFSTVYQQDGHGKLTIKNTVKELPVSLPFR